MVIKTNSLIAAHLIVFIMFMAYTSNNDYFL